MEIWQVGSRKRTFRQKLSKIQLHIIWRDGFFTFCLKMILPWIWLWQLQELVFAQKFWGPKGSTIRLPDIPCSFSSQIFDQKETCWFLLGKRRFSYKPRSQPLQNNKTQNSIFAKWAPGEDRHFDHHFDVHEAGGIKNFVKIWWLWLTEWITRPWENSICWWKKSYTHLFQNATKNSSKLEVFA